MVSETSVPKTMGTAPEGLFFPLSISLPVIALVRLALNVYQNTDGTGPVARRERLGGLLNLYYREAT